MDTNDLIKRVRKIEIKTRGLSNHIFAGEYHSAFKGRGMAFSEVREYQAGDDVRSIDWNVTARFGNPFVKVFEEERELTVMLLIDISQSGMFGTQSKFKNDLIAELAAVLSFSASINNDKVGALLFSNKVEKFIPPKKGRSHILRIIREILEFKPTEKGTDLSVPLAFLTNALKKKCTTFILSDFMDFTENMEVRFYSALRIASRKHDVAAIRIYDIRETQLPSIGLVEMKDSETAYTQLVDTSSKKVRQSYQKWWEDGTDSLQKTFSKLKVDYVNVATNQDYIRPLIQLFKKR